MTPQLPCPPLCQVASLGCRQRLLQSLIAAWPRRPDSQLSLSTGRQGVLQRVCTAVDERAAVAGTSMAGTLWHGLKVAFEQVQTSSHVPAECAFGGGGGARLAGGGPRLGAAHTCPLRQDAWRAAPPPCCRRMAWATACGASGSSCWLQS